MPMIDLVTNVSIPEEAKNGLARGLGKVIELIPGKNEGQLMLRLSGGNEMYFKGQNEAPMAYVRTDVSGKSDNENYQKFGEDAIRLISEILSIPKGNIYLTVREIPCWVVRRE